MTNKKRRNTIPSVFIPGLLIATILGWTGWKTLTAENFYKNKAIFPTHAKVIEVVDGDTVTLENNLSLRMLGIDAPDVRTRAGQDAKKFLASLVERKYVNIEYDSYQDDKYGRILGYVFARCTIRKYCIKDTMLVNEVLVKEGYAKHVVYAKRKKLKYEDRLKYVYE